MFLKRARALLRKVARVMNAAAGWMFFACAAFITFDVFARNFLGFSSKSTNEVTGYMLAFGVSWGLAHTLHERGHVRVDILINRMPLGIRQYLHCLALLLLAVFAAYATFGAVNLVRESLDFGATDMSALRVPLAIPQGLWAFGLAMLLVAALELLFHSIWLLKNKKAAQIDRLLSSRTYEDEAAEVLDAVKTEPRA
jgi:TRAP-type C4-dicarboxylate transport system permease small subunit